MQFSDANIKALQDYGNTVFSFKFVSKYGTENVIRAFKKVSGIDITLRLVEDEKPFYVAEVVGKKKNANYKPL